MNTNRFLRPTGHNTYGRTFDGFIDGVLRFRIEATSCREDGTDPCYGAFEIDPYYGGSGFLSSHHDPIRLAQAAARRLEEQEEEFADQARAEIEAEMGYERYLENRMADEYAAFEQYERGLGLY